MIPVSDVMYVNEFCGPENEKKKKNRDFSNLTTCIPQVQYKRIQKFERVLFDIQSGAQS